jgi:heat shock protein HslJ
MVFYTDRAPLEGTLWTLTSLGSVDNPGPPVEGANISATFSRHHGMPSGLVSGATGCNDYASAYYANQGDLWVNMPGTTSESCTPEMVSEEMVYFQALDAARSYRILGNELQIFFDDQVLNFVVTTPPAETGPLAPLDGTQWWLYSIDTAQVIPGSEVTALFTINADGLTGTISGSAGCNDYDAEIVGLFQVSGLNAIQSICEQPEGIMEQESAYMAALETSQEIAWDGGTLRINTGLGTLVYGNAPLSPDQPTSTPEETPTPTGETPTAEPTEEGTPQGPTETPSTEPTDESQPVAVISAPSEAQVDQMVTFDGAGSIPQDGIASYLWDYGDGTEPAEGVTIQHAYRAAGTYTITLTVRDTSGQMDIATKEITID